MIDLILVRVLPYSVLGALLGVAYFSALGWNVRLYVDYGAGWSAMFVHLMRLLVIGAAFTLCARQGALPLLSSLSRLSDDTDGRRQSSRDARSRETS